MEQGANGTTAPEKTPGKVGRYTLLAPIGSGAIGVVYAAYDPELDRRVALKLLHTNDSEQRAHLLKEAQAMARPSHPNVVAVHDVGEADGRIFVAMEFVDGQTLAQWMKARHPWRESLRLFVLAGRGLVAGHNARVIHRDFKPENVLVGKDGGVRVADFGLGHPEQRSDSSSSALGSPAYRAPEQMRGTPLDARADQFSFSVGLYEALYGERPFAGADLPTLVEEIERGRVRPEPAGSQVPARVRRALLRGLAARAEDRFATLEAMLNTLESDPLARPRRIAGTLALVLLAGVTTVWWVAREKRERAEQACHGAGSKLAHIWDDEEREKTRASFASTHLAYADAAFSTARKALDQYVSDWTEMRIDTCEATSVRHQQAPDLLDLRMACLDDRLRGIAAVSALFTAADADIVKRAPDVVAGLIPLAGCADERALREPDAPTPVQKLLLGAMRDKLAQSRALSQTGKDQAALSLMRQVMLDVQKLGYPPLEAEALIQLGVVQSRAGDLSGSLPTLEQAAAAGLRTSSYTVAATAWLQLTNLHVLLAELDQAARASEQAKAAIDRLGDNRHFQAELAITLGRFNRRVHKYDEARRQGERAVAISEQEPLLRIRALEELNNDLLESDQLIQAIPVARQALALATQVYGPDHPLTAQMEAQLAFSEEHLGDYASARAHDEHALAVLEKTNGPDHPAVADALQNLALIMTAIDPVQAIGYAQRAIRIFSRGPVTSDLLNTMTMLGDAYSAAGDHERARKELEEALALSLKTNSDPDDPGTATTRQSLGEALLALGRTKQARPVLTVALASQEKVLGPDSPVTGQTMFDIGKLELAERHTTQARRWIERSIPPDRLDGKDTADSLDRELTLAEIELRDEPEAAIVRLERLVALPAAEKGTDELFDRDRARFLLARARWAGKKDLSRAQKMAEDARDGYAARGGKFAKQRDEVERWLASTVRLAGR